VTQWNNGDYSDLILTKRLFSGVPGLAPKHDDRVIGRDARQRSGR